MKHTLFIITIALVSTISLSAEDLTIYLKKGLAEEEINRDPEAAIEQYETLLESFAKKRKHAATALFRISECHRKLDDKTATVKSLQKLIMLYPEQKELLTLAHQNLTILGFPQAEEKSNKISEEEEKAILRYRAILRDRPDVIKRSKYLTETIEANHIEAARFLLKQGSDPNAYSKIGSHIGSAVNHANLSMVKVLLQYDAEITPDSLAASVAKEYTNIQEVLLSAIKTSNQKFDYFPALDVSISRKQDSTFHKLVANGANPTLISDQGQTLLMTATKSGRVEICKTLIETYGVSVKQRNKLGYCALDYAALKRSPEIVKLLLSYGADPKAIRHDTKSGEEASVLMQLFTRDYQLEHESITNIIHQLIDAGADVNYQNESGKTALYQACDQAYYQSYDTPKLTPEERAKAVVTLLKLGADKTLRTTEQRSPMTLCYGKGLEKILGVEPGKPGTRRRIPTVRTQKK